MKKPILAILALILASLSCAEFTLPVLPVSGTPTAPVDTATPLSPTRTATVPTATPITPTAVVVKAFVNIHAEPGGAITGYVESGDPVQIVACNEENWCQIEEPAGWIWRGCLSDNPDNLGCLADK